MIVTVKVTRSTDGHWHLYSKLDTETEFIEEGDVYDATYLNSAYFGVKAKYTSTRVEETDFYNFNITGSAFTDNVPPRLDSLVSLTRYQCVFHFNEEVKVSSISYDGSPANEVVVDGKLVKASFDTPFVEKDSSLIRFSVSDTSDNALSDNVNIFYESFEVIFAEMQSADKLRFRLNKPAYSVVASNISLA
jgi:hypothetical protein